MLSHIAWVAKLVDATDLKSVERNLVPVRSRLQAPCLFFKLYKSFDAEARGNSSGQKPFVVFWHFVEA